MIAPQFVTFTGIDEQTDLARVKELSGRYPIEWGVLFGGKLGTQRYPKLAFITKALDLAADASVRFSAHLCGPFARHVTSSTVTHDDLPSLLGSDRFARLQINRSTYVIPVLQKLSELVQRPIIMQTRNNTFPEMVKTVSGDSAATTGLYMLHDTSGGKGQLPAVRPVQAPEMPFVGYAGGIGPDNVLAVLAALEAHSFWLDMEARIRSDDWLDLDKCEAVCEAIWPTR